MNDVENIKSLDEIIGQKKIVFLFKKLVEQNHLLNIIIFGEPGIGKTTCAKALAKAYNLPFDIFNSTIQNKKELEEKIANNKILIIDEIHRLNKDKQDILLPKIENKEIYVIATTTENPYFKVNPALRSRMKLFEFHKLTKDEIAQDIQQKIENKEINLNINKENLEVIIKLSNGDYRSVLSNIELLSVLFGNKKITKNDINIAIPNLTFNSDKDATAHYDMLSAFHKSLRGSDVDAALYYSHILVKSGDIDNVIRRIQAMVYEDVGLASNNLSLKVDSAIKAIERLGMPEAMLPLTYIIIELCIAPKSNSVYKATSKVKEFIKEGNIFQVPNHLRDNHFNSAKILKYGEGYKYPHNYNNNYISQQYLPKEIKNIKFFEYGSNKVEQAYKKYWEEIKKGD
ncbi:replication-associated recombination protein A [Mycoplasma phocimorsus]|uniref:replication-associated recombination protein A n=1 Tax=Mycoplasma phocimorsus TaxID=3045839 RepID=UPI0024C0BF4B|nr:replication-associated recombination protein A [Mycoplasma phocimorsus]MDJ1648733.1 replication-associated recombination protein A [Mycoplasma phocimorsus]